MNALLTKRSFFLLMTAIFMCCCYTACLTEIKLDVPESNLPSLAIRGQVVSADTAYILVQITDISDFKPFEIPEPVRGSRVRVTDNQQNSLLIPMEENGDYKLILPDSSFIRPGKSYQLEVITPDGKTYRSNQEPLHPVPLPTELKYEMVKKIVQTNGGNNIVEQQFFRYKLSTPLVNPDGSGRSYLKWRFQGVFQFTEPFKFIEFFNPDNKTCYFYEELNTGVVAAFNGALATEDFLPEFPLFEVFIDYRFLEGYYLTVYQQSLSREAYEYWEKIGALVDRQATVYDPPPGEVNGNIRNIDEPDEEVFGYFYATQEVLIRKFIPRGTVNTVPYCPEDIDLDNWTRIDRLCFNCLQRPNSTLEKPDFWVE